jgi:hypothetical protein
MALERETAYFEAHKADLLDHHAGQFAVVFEDALIGVFGQFDEAYNEGVQRLGNRPFLIRQIVEDEAPVQFPALCVGMISAHA